MPGDSLGLLRRGRADGRSVEPLQVARRVSSRGGQVDPSQDFAAGRGLADGEGPHLGSGDPWRQLQEKKNLITFPLKITSFSQ